MQSDVQNVALEFFKKMEWTYSLAKNLDRILTIDTFSMEMDSVQAFFLTVSDYFLLLHNKR